LFAESLFLSYTVTLIHLNERNHETANRNPLGLFDRHCHWRWHGRFTCGMVVVMNREDISAIQQQVNALRTEALAIIMKYLWGMGYDKEMVKQAADAWWDMKGKA
jgi:hypothetical protein